jgi:hypothetical protein
MKIEENPANLEATKKKLKDFGNVLKSIDHADNKTKLLWSEIYENAIIDRQNAHVLFVEAYSSMGSGSGDHLSLGTTLTKYLERMSKSNEQLLKLAELISKSEAAQSVIDADDIFSQIDGG